MKDIKVYLASILGFGLPSSNLLLDHAEPVIKVLLLLAQIGVAIVTILYILAKRRKVLDDRDEND